jgi:hypothetical protein
MRVAEAPRAETDLEITDIIDVFVSAIVWHSTGDWGAAAKLLAALHDQDREFSLLAEYLLAQCGESSLTLILEGLEKGIISHAEAARVVSAMWSKPAWDNGLSFGFVGNA